MKKICMKFINKGTGNQYDKVLLTSCKIKSDCKLMLKYIKYSCLNSTVLTAE